MNYKEFKVRSCTSKKTYKTISELRNAGKRMDEFYGGRIPVHGYWCKICKHYHLTTKEMTPDQMRRNNDLVF